jgi:hypothetical protein
VVLSFLSRGCLDFTGRETGCPVFSSKSSLQDLYIPGSARIFSEWFGGYTEGRPGKYRRGVLLQVTLQMTDLKLGKRKGFFIS